MRSNRLARAVPLRRALAFGVTAATAIAPTAVPLLPALTAEARAAQVTAVVTAVQAASADAREPSCGDVSDRDFPIEARIHGGPAGFRPGGGPGAWYLDLTNTTDADCRHIHPVIVLADRDRTLAVSQVTLQIRPATSGDGDRWRTLSLEKTDEDEIVGVLDDGFPGFVVPRGRTVTVSARLAFAPDTRPNRVVMSAATVQRRGGDGDWVGESNAYDFAVSGGRANKDKENKEKENRESRENKGDKGDKDKVTGADPTRPRDPNAHPTQAPESDSAPDSGVGVPPTSPPPYPPPAATPGPYEPPGPDPDPELAGTGTGGDLGGDLVGRIAAAVALLTAGVVLVVGVRRLRTGRP
ncbi:hypothetical protein ACFRKB_23795 [Streptomyces scopuliridis]|uniref:hypothetical protein n=1 Tax=Streptomyces scopuliridis TaxID=452529 RepID=UPI0036AE9C50